MYAIIATGGKQYRVSEGDELFIERIEAEAGEELAFDQVLAFSDGENFTVGAPYVEGAKVKAEVLKQGKAKKVIIFKYKSKKGYRRKNGHRQPYTKVKITQLIH